MTILASSLTLAKPHLEAGRMRAIAITNLEPAPMFPELPTIASQGVPGFDLMTQTALFAPAGTPAAAVERMLERSGGLTFVAARGGRG